VDSALGALLDEVNAEPISAHLKTVLLKKLQHAQDNIARAADLLSMQERKQAEAALKHAIRWMISFHYRVGSNAGRRGGADREKLFPMVDAIVSELRTLPGASTRATIMFAGLTGDGSSFAPYTESGLTVVSREGSWQVSTVYGHPSPFIQFLGPYEAGEPPLTAAIAVTAGGSDFAFTSVDVYSSTTPIPYVFTGVRGSTTVFTAAGTQPNTFGSFATVLNPHSTDLIDTLVISLSNPSLALCCYSNPMGLDNIVIVY
jgi:hypothetical protein